MSQDNSEGYLLLAFDDSRYLELAANFALSVRRLERRAVSVAVNAKVKVEPAIAALFDRVILADDDAQLRGAMNKARLFELTPYDRTFYIDADCLLFSPRIEFFWRRFKGQPFVVEGHRQLRGPVFACSLGEKDASALCALLGLSYLTVFNAGVMYFERSHASEEVFDKVRALYESPHRDAISYTYKHAGEYADEPFFAAALASLGIPPLESPPGARLQVTTPNIKEGIMDLDTGELRVLKQAPGGPPQLWSGVLCHFCGLVPMDTYFELADKLRREAKLPPMDRSRFNPVVLTQAQHRENV
ncbi:MAG: hypothetical protein AB7E79_15365 [Rhodospirillaceae bacterium]